MDIPPLSSIQSHKYSPLQTFTLASSSHHPQRQIQVSSILCSNPMLPFHPLSRKQRHNTSNHHTVFAFPISTHHRRPIHLLSHTRILQLSLQQRNNTSEQSISSTILQPLHSSQNHSLPCLLNYASSSTPPNHSVLSIGIHLLPSIESK